MLFVVLLCSVVGVWGDFFLICDECSWNASTISIIVVSSNRLFPEFHGLFPTSLASLSSFMEWPTIMCKLGAQ